MPFKSKAQRRKFAELLVNPSRAPGSRNAPQRLVTEYDRKP